MADTVISPSLTMHHCHFELNGRPLSLFRIGALSIPAFSGLSPYINIRSAACFPDKGPIPPGRYYVLNRESGGKLGWFYDRFNRHSDWFSLYADDGRIDDTTFCNQVARGHFRLHPKGPRGISKGCIVIDNPPDFYRISSIITGSAKFPIPGSALLADGTVLVR
jgi:hypothetical protein